LNQEKDRDMDASGATSMDFGKLPWLFPVAVALHNTEEAIWMPGWDARHATELAVHPSGDFEIKFLLFVLALAAFVITSLRASRAAEYLGLPGVRIHRRDAGECVCSSRTGGDSVSWLRAGSGYGGDDQSSADELFGFACGAGAVGDGWKALAFGAGVPLVIGSGIVAWLAEQSSR
jgi:hypothetical protein